MSRRVTIVVGAVLAAGSLLVACSYSKKDDSVTPSALGTVPTVPAGGPTGVVGTLPPISTAPATAATTAAAAAPATTPGTTAAAPATTPATTRVTVPATSPATSPATTPASTPASPGTAAPPASSASGTVLVQAGAYDTRAAAAQAVSTLAAKGFGGFAVSGNGPFRVVRSGLSPAAANKLVQSLAAAGIAAYVRG